MVSDESLMLLSFQKYKSLSKDRIIALIELGFDFKAPDSAVKTETVGALETNIAHVSVPGSTNQAPQGEGPSMEQERAHNIPHIAPHVRPTSPPTNNNHQHSTMMMRSDG